MKKRIKIKHNQYWLIIICIAIIILALLLSLKPTDLQKFSDRVVDGASNDNATLEDGLKFAEEYSQDFVTAKAINIDNILDKFDDVKDKAIDFNIDSTNSIETQISNIMTKTKFKTTTIQTASKNKKFKILIIGNDISHNKLVSWCKEIQKEFNSLEPYSQISNQFTITCGSLPFNIKNVNSNTAAKAFILAIAKIKKQELGYDIAIVIENNNCRSFAIPTFSSLVCYEKGKTVKIFMHELSHSFAGLADEYSNTKDIVVINNIIKKLSLNIKINDQLDLFSYSGLIDPPNCIKKPKEGCGSWFEGCALVPKNTCRPSKNSMMRDSTYEKFNDESIKRILDVAKGKKIVTGTGIIK